MKFHFIALYFFTVFFSPLYAYSISIGDDVSMVADNVKVRTCAGISCSHIGNVSIFTIGKVIDGPEDKDGYYWWKVDWDDSSPDGWTPTPKNDYSWFYEKPTGLSPGGSSSTPIVIAYDKPTLSWNKVHGAHHYLISIKEKSSDDVTYHDNISGDATSYTLPNSLDKGKRYLWSVIPYDDDNDTGLKAEYVYFDVIEKANSAYDLTVRPDDITIRSQSGDDNIINVGEEFDVRVNIRNVGDADSGSYKVRYYYKNSGNSTLSSFDTDSNTGTATGVSSTETSDYKIVEGTSGVHYVKVCVYDNNDDSDHNNDCGLKSFEVEENEALNTPTISSITPEHVNSSFEQREIIITGTNFNSNSILQTSHDGINFTDISLPLVITDTNIKFSKILFSKTGYEYFRVKNGSKLSDIDQIQVDYNPPIPPTLFYTGEDNIENVSGQEISFEFIGLDLEDILDYGATNYKLVVDWGDGNKEEYTKQYSDVIPIAHIYSSTTTKYFTITAYMEDSEGYKSKRIKVQVIIKGSESTTNIEDIALGDINVAKDLCAKSRSVGNAIDKASGAENFSLTPMKVKGLYDLPFTLQYNSLLLSNGDISKGWSHNYNFSSYVEMKRNGDIRLYWDNSAKKYNDFIDDTSTLSKIYTSSDKATQDDVLTLLDDDTYVLNRKDGSVYKYNILGYLVSIKNYKSQEIQVTFDDEGRLTKVKDKVSGVFLTYFYNDDGTLDRVKDNLDRITNLSYNSDQLLYKISYPNDTDHYFYYNDNEQIYKHDIRRSVDGVLEKIIVFDLAYLDNNKVSSEKDGEGHESTFSYNEVGDKIESTYTNEAGEKTTTIYDAINFNPYTITHPDASKEVFTYYSNGKKKSYTNRSGYTTNYAYDDEGNLNEVVYDDGSKEQYEYDVNRNIIKKTVISKDATSFVTINTYDNQNNLKTTILPNEDLHSYDYNDDGQIIKKTINGISTHYRYNDKGYLEEVKSAENLTTSYTYDAAGKMVTETNPQGGTNTYTYDIMDHVVSIENAAGKIRSFKYDFLGRKIEETDFMGNISQYKYDDNGNMIKKIDALGFEYSFEYDNADRLSKSFDPLNNFIEYQYDSMDRVIKTIDKRGNTTTYEYDAMGNLKSQYDANGNKLFTNTYNSKNELIESVDILNQTTKTDYTIFSKPSKVTDPLLRVNEFKYDKLGRLIKVINTAKKEAIQIYTPAGQLKEFTDAGGSKTTFTYNGDGKLLTTSTASGSKSSNVYDTTGLLTTFTNGRNDAKTFKYDNLGRVIEADDKDGTITYTYDDNSNLLTITEHNQTIMYEYDKLNRIVAYTDVHGDAINYGYDMLSNITYITYPHGKQVEYKYDANSNLIEVKDTTKITTYQYDKNNRLTSMTRPNGTVLTREYNAAGQLILQTDKTSTGIVISSVRFEYDAVGNIKVEEREPKVEPKLPVDINMSYLHGNLLQEANQTQAIFDADDNMLSFGKSNYTYDSRNRLTANSSSTTYSYDTKNNRVSQTINGKTTTYTVNPNSSLSQLLEATDENGSTTVYTYGSGLLSQTKNGKTLYYHYDLRGSTIAMSDDSGKIVDRWTYLPFGGQISHDTGTTQTPFLYNGRDGVMTDKSGLYYMRARYYDPNIRRFINRDILLGEVGLMATLNRFGYVNGNPVSGVDPLGLYSWSAFTQHVSGSADIVSGTIGTTVGGLLTIFGSGLNDLTGISVVEDHARAFTDESLQTYTKGINNVISAVGADESLLRDSSQLRNTINPTAKETYLDEIYDYANLAKSGYNIYKSLDNVKSIKSNLNIINRKPNTRSSELEDKFNYKGLKLTIQKLNEKGKIGKNLNDISTDGLEAYLGTLCD